MNYELGLMIMVNKIVSFKDLDAWKEGHKLVLMVYDVTRDYPKDEMFGLISQSRRCVVSITSNIAEGFSRNSYKEKLQFYSMSQGSLTELQNLILIAKDVGYLKEEEYNLLNNQSVLVQKIINGLVKKSRFIIQNS